MEKNKTLFTDSMIVYVANPEKSPGEAGGTLL